MRTLSMMLGILMLIGCAETEQKPPAQPSQQEIAYQKRQAEIAQEAQQRQAEILQEGQQRQAEWERIKAAHEQQAQEQRARMDEMTRTAEARLLEHSAPYPNQPDSAPIPPMIDPNGPCDEPVGIYRIHSVEQPGGTCGKMSDGLVTFKRKFAKGVLMKCRIRLKTGFVDWNSDGSIGHGLREFSDRTCFSMYAETYTKQ